MTFKILKDFLHYGGLAGLGKKADSQRQKFLSGQTSLLYIVVELNMSSLVLLLFISKLGEVAPLVSNFPELPPPFYTVILLCVIARIRQA